jgi:multisubunit Na+/H+ antiporter MnhC subunit
MEAWLFPLKLMSILLLLIALLLFQGAIFCIYRRDTIGRWIAAVALSGAGIICVYYGIGLL